MSEGDILRVTTERMAYGPHAVARSDGKVVFVRGGAPEEELDVVVTEERRSHSYADMLAVVRPSPARRVPPCPYLPRCGGCPWQHLDYPAQLTAKREIVAEQLRRIGGLEATVSPVLSSPHEYGYRRRLKLRTEGGEVGFYGAASHRLVAVEHCLLAEPLVDRAIPWARDLVGELRTRLRRIEITRTGKDARVAVAAEAQGAWQPDDEGRCSQWLAAHPEVSGIHLAGRAWQRSFGDPAVRIEPEPGVSLTVTARAFTQVSAAANRELVATVVRLAEPRPGLSVLELYAGAGNFSIPLARRGAQVLAVETDRRAAEDARRNGAALLTAGPLRVRSARAERVVAELAREGSRFDLVLLDPPRSGAAALMAGLLEIDAPAIVYVSCDPATLARDLKALAGRYHVDVVQPIDMFPHSYHVETVVRARRVYSGAGCQPERAPSRENYRKVP